MKPPTNHPAHTIQPSRFTAAQRQALDAIGQALKHRQIDFHTAAELSDMVKADRTREALALLESDADDK